MKKEKRQTNTSHTITRKSAIKKGIAALTASTVMFLETQAESQASASTTPRSPNNPNRNPR